MFWTILQDTMNEFYTGRSSGDKGTLFYLKNRFGHKNATNDTSKTFNHIWDLLKFVTHGLVSLLACHLLGIQNITSTPEETANEKLLDTLAKKIVQTVWQEHNYGAFLEEEDIHLPEQRYCDCKMGK